MTRTATLSLSPRRFGEGRVLLPRPTTPRRHRRHRCHRRQSLPIHRRPQLLRNVHALLPHQRYRLGTGALRGVGAKPRVIRTGVPIIILNMAIGPRITAPHTDPFNPTQFATSWILPPAVLFGVRALLALYAFATLFTIFGWNGGHGRSAESQQSFSYFTVLTYWGLAFYYAFAAVHTGSYWRTGEPFLAGWPRALQVAHSMLYSTIVVYPWLVTSKWAAQDCVYA